jgi:hypothetical protein
LWNRIANTPTLGARKSTRRATLLDTMRHCSETWNEVSPI